MMMNYYNEFDPKAAAWLRVLIANEQIPNGDVDERSITEVKPDELTKYTQCHFFAGIGGWSYALKLAGWPVTRKVWTGSCPCQPFSVAGTGKGTADERHLWPEFFRLIKACRPSIIFGEQVASKLGRDWLGKVAFDLEHPFYENDTREILHILQADEAFFRLPPIQGAMQGWIEADLQRLSAGIRKEVAKIVQGKIKKGSMDSISKSEGIREAIPGAIQGSLFDCGNSPALRCEENSVRPESTHRGNPEPNKKRVVRSDGLSDGHNPAQIQIRAEAERAVNRSEESEGGLHLQQHSDCVLGCEHDDGELGRKFREANNKILDGENINELARRIGQKIEGEIQSGRIAGVSANLEALAYRFGAADLCSAGVGSPNIRQRLYWVANAQYNRLNRENGDAPEQGGNRPDNGLLVGGGGELCESGWLAITKSQGRPGVEPELQAGIGHRSWAGGDSPVGGLAHTNSKQDLAPNTGGLHAEPASGGTAGGLVNAFQSRLEGLPGYGDHRDQPGRLDQEPDGPATTASGSGHWSAHDLLHCTDGKTRRIEPGSFPLAHGVPGRVGLLRGYGNAINPWLASQFIGAFLDSE